MNIDMFGNYVPNDALIEAEMQRIINATWPPASREKALRTGLLKAELDAFFVDMSTLKQQVISDRDLLEVTIGYEVAQRRLTMEQLPTDIDIEERSVAQSIIDGASAEVVTLATQRANV